MSKDTIHVFNNLNIKGVIANGEIGTAGQVLHSNGSIAYWALDDNAGGTITSVATANGLSGGPITTTGTIGVVTGSTLTVNVSGIHVNTANLSIATSQLTGDVALGTNTSGNYVATIAASNGISGSSSTEGGTPTIGVVTGSSLTVNTSGIHVNSALSITDLALTGNLTVSGTRTYINTTTLEVGDNIVTLNADLGANPPTENAGIEIMRGTSANAQFIWDETNDRWSTNGQPIAISSLVAAGAASGITTLAAGNTTITGFANVTGTITSTSTSGIRVEANDAQYRLTTASGQGWRIGTTSTSTTYGKFYIQGSIDGFVSSFINAIDINTSGGVVLASTVSGITTLAAGNTTITGFANVSSSIQGGSSLTIAGAASGITTLAAGNTTVTGFANVAGNILSRNLLMQGDNTNAYIRPTNTPSNLYLGANNTNIVTIFANGNLTTSSSLTVAGPVSGVTTLAAGNTTITGFASATTEIRAPIFKDSDNTAYYTDPAGTSVLNIADIYGNAYTRGDIYNLDAAGTGWNTVVARNSGSTIIYGGNSVRAPIFYDSDNTAYYTDPAGTSVINAAIVNGTRTSFVLGSLGVSTTVRLLSIEGNYDTGQFAHRFRKEDLGGGIPLSLDYSMGTAGSYTQLVQWGPYTGDGGYLIRHQSSTRIAGNLMVKRDANSTNVGDSASIVLSNRNTSINGGIMGGIFADTFRDVVDPHYSAGMWFTRVQQVSNLSSSSEIVFGTASSAESNTIPTERMRINTAGNVGIGTNSPTSKLFVEGTIQARSGSTGVSVYGDGGAGYINGIGAFPLIFNTNGAERLRIDATGIISGNGKTMFETADTYLRINQSSTFASGTWFGATLVRSDGFYAGSNGGTTSSRVYMSSGTYNGTNVIALDGSNGRITALDVRAPIYYDSDNTAYYIDAASTSVLNALSVASGNVIGSVITFNNMNQTHGTYTDANLVGDFGFRYLQAGTNGPGITSATQYYGMTLGLGNDYAFSLYASQFYWPRTSSGGLPYPSIRFREAGTWGSWSKIYAGWADAPSGATFTATGDFRAPIFYDSDNTAYYVDPASNGTRAGFINGNLWINPKSESYGEGIVFNMPNQNTWGGLRWYRNGPGASYAGNWAFGYFGGENTNDIGFHNGTNGWRLDHSYNNTVAGSFRAPIFYDSNDTTYFVNPNSTSSIYNTLTIGPNITYGRYLRLGGDAGDVTEATVAASNGNLHIDAKTGYKLYLSWFNTADTMVGGAIQALAYYDRDNTAYYIDATSTSVLSALSLGGRSTTYAMYYQGFTLDANTMDHNASGFTYAVNAPAVGPIVRFSAGGGYDLQLNAPYSGNGNKLFYRTRQGDAGIFNSWYAVATYGVSYSGELFATKFTDADSSGYYCDPASNSVFDALTIRKGGISLGSGNSRQLEISNAGTGACNISFHRENQYGAHFGLDTDNWFSTFGWSAGGGYTSMRVGAIETDVHMRRTHSSGHLRGGYNNIGGSEGYTSPIYTIGSSYEPAATTLGNMYGIGFTASGSFFPSGASAWGMYVASDGVARIFLSGGNGEITATGNITAYASDRRLKTNITPITNAVDKLMQINGVEFDWVDNIQDIGFIPQQMHETGVIAQEIQSVIPDAVKTAPFNNNATDIAGFDSDYLTVDKEKIIPLLIEAIKEQQAHINKLETKINSFEQRLI